MEGSVWDATLDGFYAALASSKPLPAGVAASTVSARLGIALLMKVLQVSKPTDLTERLDAARRESENLKSAADDDIAAFRRYMECARNPQASPEQLQLAWREAVDVPILGARAAAAGLDLCAQAAAAVRSSVAADLTAAATLLAASVRAMLVCVDSNLTQLTSRDPHREVAVAERRDLEERVQRQLEIVLSLGASRLEDLGEE